MATTAGTISSAMELIEPKKEDLKKAFFELQSHSDVLSLFSLTWSDLDSHFTSLQNSLTQKLQLLQTLESQSTNPSSSTPSAQTQTQITQDPSPSQKPQDPSSSSSNLQTQIAKDPPKAPTQIPKNPPLSTQVANDPSPSSNSRTQNHESVAVPPRPELVAFCEKMDAIGLRKYMNDSKNNRNTIDPSQVRKQTGDHFGEAFLRHERDFQGNPDKVQSWRAALERVGNLSGWHLKHYGYESKLIGDIVGKIFSKLNQTIPILPPFSSPPPPPPPRWKYDVYLSFSGEGTHLHLDFVNQIYDALEKKGIVAFRDDKIRERGESISTQVVKAIEESKVALVFLSSSYASSSWCLDELLKIMQWRDEMQLHVIPVFYHVKAHEMRHQRGDFQFLLKPEVREHEEVHWENRNKLKERQHKWRFALGDVAGMTGWHMSNGLEDAEYILDITEDVRRRVYTSSYVDKGFVGMESRVDDLLCNYICPGSIGISSSD